MTSIQCSKCINWRLLIISLESSQKHNVLPCYVSCVTALTVRLICGAVALQPYELVSPGQSTVQMKYMTTWKDKY